MVVELPALGDGDNEVMIRPYLRFSPSTLISPHRLAALKLFGASSFCWRGCRAGDFSIDEDADYGGVTMIWMAMRTFEI